MLYEISRSTIHLTKYEDIDIVWHNNVLTVRCDSGLHLYDFSYNLKCLDKTIDLIESKILTSKCSPATDLFPKNGLATLDVKNMELSEMVLDPSLWPHNKSLMEVAIVVSFEWSPVDFIHNNESVIATVNSGGNVDLYAQSRHKWGMLENLSPKLKQEIYNKIPNLIPTISLSAKINFKLLKEAAYALETSSICWSPTLNQDKSCYFVTGQKNTYILFWWLKYEKTGVKVKLLQYVSDNKEEIVTMKWIPISTNEFILIASNIQGQIIAYRCQIVNDVVHILGSNSLWAHKDKMIAKYIQYESTNENIVIVCNKHRHMLLLVIDKVCKVLYQNVTNVNDNKISSVLRSNKSFYMSTVNREFYEINYVVENEALNVNFVFVDIKCTPALCELYGIAFSSNDVILAAALLDRTVLFRKMPMTLDIVLYTDESHNLIATIMDNPARTLSNSWDVIELLRCKILKTKTLPNLDYSKLYTEAQTDSFLGKVYLTLLSFYNTLEITVQNGSRGLLPVSSIDVVKSNILACHSIAFIEKLYKIHADIMTENIADTFELQCLYMAATYLKEFCNKNKKNLQEVLSPNILNMLEQIKSPQYTCQWCDNILNGFSCKDGHINPFCSLTFTLIESNKYLTCRCCGATAQCEIYLDKPKCVFCDFYLCYCHLPL